MSEGQYEDIFGRTAKPIWVNKFGIILRQGTMGRLRTTGADSNRITEEEGQFNRSRIILEQDNGPCDKYEIIIKFIVKLDEPFDLRPYKNAGHPGWVWELQEVGSRHWENPYERCGQNNYGYGFVDENGVLVGLRDTMESRWSHKGYMVLSQGPFDCTLGGWRTACYVYKQKDGRIRSYLI